MNHVLDLAQTGALSGPPIFHILGVVLQFKRVFLPSSKHSKGYPSFCFVGGGGGSAVKT